jgi:nicotinamidase-related amidase
MGPREGFGPERIFEKDVFGAFTGTALEEWLRSQRVSGVLIVGFYAHMCVATTTREALMRGFAASVDPDATGAADLDHESLGHRKADDVRRSAFLHLTHMGATVFRGAPR